MSLVSKNTSDAKMVQTLIPWVGLLVLSIPFGAPAYGQNSEQKELLVQGATSESAASAVPNTAVVNLEDVGVAADNIPEGQELVNIDFPEPTDIKDIIRAVSLWTGKNVILGRDVNGKVQMISPRKVTKEEAYQAFLSSLNLLGLTTVETGKVIKILPTRSAIKGNLKTYLGASYTPLTDEMITQIVPLKYIDAKEIQTTLSRIANSNSMIAYQPTNTLIISDSGYKVRRILDIIDLLDVQGQQPKLSIVPIKYADAKQIADKVQMIFKAKSSDKNSKTSYMTYKIMTDERTNSVIIFGPPRTIADVKGLVQKFDIRVTDPSRQATIHVRPLDYADAKKLASTLSALAQGSKNRSNTRRPPVGRAKRKNSNTTPDVAEFDGNLKITADDSSNSLLITGSRAAYDAMNSIIRKLDIRQSQVFVEADILDVKVDGNFGFGTSIFAGRKNSIRNHNVAYTWDAGKMAPLLASGLSSAATDTKTGAALGAFATNFNIGLLAGFKVDIPGIGEVSPGALINFIKKDAASRELAAPAILTKNNEEAVISVGEKLFFRSAGDTNITSGITQPKVESEPVDLTLQIKPNISHTNYITMKVDLDANSGSVSALGLPNVTKRKISQKVTVKSGQTVVISGLMKTSEQETYSKIPLLGDIPILGWLFRNSNISKIRTNLMIFMTPYIVHGADDLAAIYKKKLKERDEFFQIMYGSNFQDEEFYKLLPGKEDGVYRADAYESIEKANRIKRAKDLQSAMGGEGSAVIRPLKSAEMVSPEAQPVDDALDEVQADASRVDEQAIEGSETTVDEQDAVRGAVEGARGNDPMPNIEPVPDGGSKDESNKPN